MICPFDCNHWGNLTLALAGMQVPIRILRLHHPRPVYDSPDYEGEVTETT